MWWEQRERKLNQEWREQVRELREREWRPLPQYRPFYPPVMMQSPPPPTPPEFYPSHIAVMMQSPPPPKPPPKE
ncbi:hypothetical protein AGMMS49593_07130 [Endomicrobiia bacterium]|nr:hypothetical protein AGMMS49593_07130 [Endomicrobiia bacterium]